jgi:23S rRNA pseudouridine955/2504/2580 synthase
MPVSPKVRLVQIAADHDGQRLDNFLMSQLKGVPRSMIYRIIRKGEVRVNGGRSKPTHKLALGDEVRVPPVRTGEKAGPARIPDSVMQRLAEAEIYRSDDLIVIDKPAGLAVHAGSGLSFGVIEAMRQLHGAPELELVHRLDRETSGCLVLARNRQALLSLQEVFAGNQIDKRYLALVPAPWPHGRVEVDAPLRKNVQRGGERMVEVDETGKAARTEFVDLERYGPATMVEARLFTGRTHQIRVHAAHIANPVAGDGKYGDKKFNARLAQLGLKRLFLHAHRLTLPTVDGDSVVINAPMPEALSEVLNACRAAGKSSRR